ncbi:MAG: hypothetical protein IPP19_09445 [Verrucomicrobia bacterium]|nr:hypothetical protein [Verrucomicrobiota bacterium]
MKTLGYSILTCSVLWLALVGLHDLLWLVRPVVVPSRYLWWVMRLPLPRPHSDSDFAVVWPLLVGIGGVMIATALNTYADRKMKQRKEGSEA